MNQTDASALMSEISHRVKNNMQMLQSLLGAAAREVSIPEAREVLTDAVRRVGAMAAAQNSLYCIDATNFEARALLEALVRNVSQGAGGKADIQIEAASGRLANDAAVPLALIANELITNAVKHARGERSHVSIRIVLLQEGPEWVLAVVDDGPGFAMGQPHKRASGLGLVIALAKQLGGTLNVSTDRGARCVVRFGGPRSAR